MCRAGGKGSASGVFATVVVNASSTAYPSCCCFWSPWPPCPSNCRLRRQRIRALRPGRRHLRRGCGIRCSGLAQKRLIMRCWKCSWDAFPDSLSSQRPHCPILQGGLHHWAASDPGRVFVPPAGLGRPPLGFYWVIMFAFPCPDGGRWPRISGRRSPALSWAHRPGDHDSRKPGLVRHLELAALRPAALGSYRAVAKATLLWPTSPISCHYPGGLVCPYLRNFSLREIQTGGFGQIRIPVGVKPVNLRREASFPSGRQAPALCRGHAGTHGNFLDIRGIINYDLRKIFLTRAKLPRRIQYVAQTLPEHCLAVGGCESDVDIGCLSPGPSDPRGQTGRYSLGNFQPVLWG